jgi:hypothetical protein
MFDCWNRIWSYRRILEVNIEKWKGKRELKKIEREMEKLKENIDKI